MRAPAPRLVLLALVAACGGGAAVPGAGPADPRVESRTPVTFTAGGPWRYRYDRTDTLTTALPNGGKQQQVVDRHLVLRWEATSTPAGLALSVTIDSVRLTGVPMGRTLEDSARGTVLRATLTPQGRVSAFTPSTPSLVARALVTELPWLIPALPASLAPGASLVDTLTTTVPFSRVDLAETTIRTTAIGTAMGTFDIAATVVRDGVSPELRVVGGGSRAGRADFGASGPMRSATGRDSTSMTVTVAAMGQSVGVTQVGTYALTLLP